MNKVIIFSILAFNAFTCFSQKEDYNWIFYNHWSDNPENLEMWGASVLDFNTIPPQAYKRNEITLDFAKANHILSDKNGDILFYSNAMSVHDSSNTSIINGDTINYSNIWDNFTTTNYYGESVATGFLFPGMINSVPYPEREEEWLLLYHDYATADDTNLVSLKSSDIFRNDNGDLELKNKDILIKDDVMRPGTITACQHANGRDWWLLQFNGNRVYTFLLDHKGIKLDFTQALPFNVRLTLGQSKFNQQGTAFASYGWVHTDITGFSDIFYSDFDRETGFLINPQMFFIEDFGEESQTDFISNSSLNNGVEFSPSGRFLYTCSRRQVMQFDTWEEDIFGSKIIVAEWDGTVCGSFDYIAGYGLMQLGPDRKIYISGNHQCYDIHRINYPDKKGDACGMQDRAIRLESFHMGTIPNYNTLRLGPIDGSPSDTLGIDNHPVAKFTYQQDSMDYVSIDFVDLSYYRPENWMWDFGDGNTSVEPSPSHVYASDGSYEVCLTVSNENSSSTSCDTLHLGTSAIGKLHIDPEISIFPNPVEDYTRVAFHNYLPKDAEIVFYNSKSKRILSKRLHTNENMIDLSGLVSGAYFYRVMDSGVFVVEGMLVKI